MMPEAEVFLGETVLAPYEMPGSRKVADIVGNAAVDHPEFDAFVREIEGKARARGFGAGIHYWLGVEQQIAWARAGATAPRVDC